jgi:hypothetical protein
MIKGPRTAHPRHADKMEELLDNLGADGVVKLLSDQLAEIINDLGIADYSTEEIEKVEELIELLDKWKESVE